MIKVYRQADNILRLGNTVAAGNLLGNGLKHDDINDVFKFAETTENTFTTDDDFTFEFWIELKAGNSQFWNNLLSNRDWSLNPSDRRALIFGLPRTNNEKTHTFFVAQNGNHIRLSQEPRLSFGLRHIIYRYVGATKTLSIIVDNEIKVEEALPVNSGINLFTGHGYTSDIVGNAVIYSSSTYYILRIFNKALSNSEISDLYGVKVPNTAVANIVQEINFDQNRGNTAIATVGSSATLTGFSNTTDYGGDGTTAAWVDPKGGVAT